MKAVLKFLTIACITTGLHQTSYAKSICRFSLAKTECGIGRLNQLNAVGKILLNGTNIIGDTNIAGRLYANNANLGSLKIAGKTHLNSTTVHNNVKISGTLHAKNSTFIKKITIAAGKIYFNNSKTNNIEVRRSEYPESIFITNNTTINGNIVFKSRQGNIFIDSTSNILGKIIGGHIIRNNFKYQPEGKTNEIN